MKAIDNKVYEEVCDAVNRDYPKGRNKPVIAYEFFKRVGSEQPEKIEVVLELIKEIITS
ncbi:MAG TPA: hypothetical protein VE378_07315 [Nitrososphaeraceae archaeon]|jgi:hypothetical protein|nr:hypothetical protein [Nitrososphaeraceae archaeon]